MADPLFSDISGFSPQEQAALTYHRSNLINGTSKKNKDNSLTTFFGSVVDTPEGGAMILPTYWHGEVRDIPQAMRFAIKSGIDFPKYGSVDEALGAEKRMHDIMEQDVNAYSKGK